MFDKYKQSLNSDFGKVLIGFASSQLVGNFLKMLAGFIIVKLVTPEVYGQFTGHGIFLGYLSLVHFGVLNGLSRELPVEQGKNNWKKVTELAEVSLWICNAIAIPSAIILICFSIYSVVNQDINGLLLNLAYAFAAFFILYNKFYLPILYRSNRDFSKLTKVTLYSSVVNIVSILFIFLDANIQALCVRLIVINIAEFGFLYYFAPIKVKAKWKYSNFIILTKVGLPIFIVGNVLPLWETIKNTIIFSIGGPIQFGYYALVNVINGAVGIIPNSFSQIMYPKMAIAYGNNLEKSKILKMNYKPMLLLFFVSLVMFVIGFLFLPYLVKSFLPKYIPGINAALWALCIPLVSAFSLINNYFNVYKLQKLYFIGILSGIVVSIIFIVIMNYIYGFNLEMFVQSLILGTVVQNILCWKFIVNDVTRNIDAKKLYN